MSHLLLLLLLLVGEGPADLLGGVAAGATGCGLVVVALVCHGVGHLLHITQYILQHGHVLGRNPINIILNLPILHYLDVAV